MSVVHWLKWFPYRMQKRWQLWWWVKGKSKHIGTKTDGECCPDFSCCEPSLLAPKEERELFAQLYKAKQYKEYEGMLMMFLGRGLPLMTEKKCYVTDGEHGGTVN